MGTAVPLDQSEALKLINNIINNGVKYRVVSFMSILMMSDPEVLETLFLFFIHDNFFALCIIPFI